LAQFQHSPTFTQIVILIDLNEYNDLFIILSHTSLKNWEISEFSCKELMKKAEGEQGSNVPDVPWHVWEPGERILINK